MPASGQRLQLAVLVNEVVHRRIDPLAARIPLDMAGGAVVALHHFGQRLLDRGRVEPGFDHRLGQQGHRIIGVVVVRQRIPLVLLGVGLLDRLAAGRVEPAIVDAGQLAVHPLVVLDVEDRGIGGVPGRVDAELAGRLEYRLGVVAIAGGHDRVGLGLQHRLHVGTVVGLALGIDDLAQDLAALGLEGRRGRVHQSGAEGVVGHHEHRGLGPLGGDVVAELLADDVVERQRAEHGAGIVAELRRAGRGVEDDLALRRRHLGDRNGDAAAAEDDRGVDLVDVEQLGRGVEPGLRPVFRILDDQLDRPALDAAGGIDPLDRELDAMDHVGARLDVGAGQVGDDADRDRILGQRVAGTEGRQAEQAGADGKCK